MSRSSRPAASRLTAGTLALASGALLFSAAAPHLSASSSAPFAAPVDAIAPAAAAVTLPVGAHQEAAGKPAPAPSADPAEAAAVAKWLKDNAVPVKSVIAGQPLDDLRKFKASLANVQLFGLGEATHGTREFFQFKHRMLEFLVKEMGVTVFAIEASYPACLNINEYVLHGKGDPAKALASQGFWTWDTNEVSDMIAWMRAYNEKAPAGKKVQFLGYDLQHLQQGFDVIPAYLQKVAPEHVDVAKAAFKPFVSSTSGLAGFPKMSAEEKAKSLNDLQQIVAFLALREAAFVQMTTREEFDTAIQHARTLVQFADAYGRNLMDPDPAKSGIGLRDLYMADNIAHIVRTSAPGTKIAVWAHNGHVGTDTIGPGAVAMGAHLRRLFGDKYYAIGFAFNEGGFQSRDMDGKMVLKEFVAPPAPAGSLDAALAQVGQPMFLLDLRHAPKSGPVADWLSTEHAMRSIGSGYATSKADQFLAPTAVRKTYDGLFFIDKTTRARPNPTGMRGAIEETK